MLSMRNKVNRLEEIFMRLIEKNGSNGSGTSTNALNAAAAFNAATAARSQGGRS